ncbi:hypothetical protein TGAMA5MH_09008 [Trichoderma gamsii]|uniref:Uncharacterized protein n=1 Tax=Trichoderma gamsii TaxID=398673 RepID=A0A2K0SZT5_9HYPO|nr:hypothetical protein TGAMA5MH_09008 [Trichoderma gamsii]
MKVLSFVALLFATAKAAHGQAIPTFPDAEVQTTGWNSSFKFSKEQIQHGQPSPELASSLEVILNFDRSQLANGGPSQDRWCDTIAGGPQVFLPWIAHYIGGVYPDFELSDWLSPLGNARLELLN